MTGRNQKTRPGLGETQNIVLFTFPNIRPEKIRRIKAETGFGGKSSWFNPVFGNHLINLCQKKRLKSAMITDDSFENFLQVRGLGEWWVSASLLPTLRFGSCRSKKTYVRFKNQNGGCTKLPILL